MAEFLFFLAILIQCGVFPMGPSDCQPAVPQSSLERAPVVAIESLVESP